MRSSLPFRMSVTKKLFFSGLLLIAIFCATTLYLYLSIQEIVANSSDIVSRNFMVADAADRSAQTLLSMLENKKRFEILGSTEYRENYDLDLQSYQDSLQAIVLLSPPEPDRWEALSVESAQTGDTAEPALLSDEIIGNWLEQISQLRQSNQAQIEDRLREISMAGQRAGQIGFAGLTLSLAAGLLGASFMAYRLGGSFRELKRGIEDLHHKGTSSYVHVTSRDELGDLAGAFNEMTSRLEQEERMREDFIAMLASQISAPLAGLEGTLHRLQKDQTPPLAPKHRGLLKLCERELEQVRVLFDRVMRISEMEVGEYPMLPREIEGSRLIKESVNKLRSKASKKEITIQTVASENQTNVLADLNHIRQALTAILDHAVAASPPGSTVKIGAVYRDETEKVVFWVKDSAPPLPEKDRKRIFHQYYRWPGSESDSRFGNGLNFSKRIVEVHGGSIWVSGNNGSGNIISFTLPSAGGNWSKELV